MSDLEVYRSELLRVQRLRQEAAVAVCMGQHARLGQDSGLRHLDEPFIESIVDFAFPVPTDPGLSVPPPVPMDQGLSVPRRRGIGRAFFWNGISNRNRYAGEAIFPSNTPQARDPDPSGGRW